MDGQTWRIFLATYSISSRIRSLVKLWTFVYQLVPCTQNVHVKGQPRFVSINGASLPSKNSSRDPVSQGDGISSISLRRSQLASRTTLRSGRRYTDEGMTRF